MKFLNNYMHINKCERFVMVRTKFKCDLDWEKTEGFNFDHYDQAKVDGMAY